MSLEFKINVTSLVITWILYLTVAATKLSNDSTDFGL